MPAVLYNPAFLFSGHDLPACRFVCVCVFVCILALKLCKVLYVHTDRGFVSLSGFDLYMFRSGSLHSHWKWLPLMPLSLLAFEFVSLPHSTTQHSLLLFSLM